MNAPDTQDLSNPAVPALVKRFPGLVAALLLLFLALAIQVWVVVIAGLAHGVFEIDWLDPRQLLVPGIANLFSMLAILLIGITGNSDTFGDIVGRRMPGPALLLAGTVVAIGAQVVVSDLTNLLMDLAPRIQVFAEQLEELVGDDQSVVTIVLLLIVVAPLGEELVFRGVLLHGFLSRYRPWLAIILSAALFGIVHMNPIQAPGALVLGIIFGWWRLRSDSILLCIWGHAVNNSVPALLYPVFGIAIEGYNVAGPETRFQPIWFTGTGLALLILGIVWMKRIFARQPAAVPQSMQATAPPPTETGNVTELPWE